jgi:cell division protein FtsQ
MELSLPFPRHAQRSGARRPARRSDGRTGHALDWLLHNRLALRTAICAAVVLPLLGGGWLWLRDSSLVSVRHVHIAGVHGVDAIEIRRALDNAAVRMTTMHFDVAALRSAVSSFAIVGSLRVSTSFPHSVSITVTERPPVAALLTAGQRTAVAADGTVLGPALLSSSLPTIAGSVEPPAGARLRETAAIAAVAVLGAAPAPLAAFVVRVLNGPEGLTVAMRNGLLVYFGNSQRPHAKWLSLARVLVSPSASGATYIDVRLPERPAAGFSSTSSASTASSAGSSSSPTRLEGSEPTAAALAASLSKAAGASAGSPVGSAAGSSSTGEEKEAAHHSETTSSSSTSGATGESEASSGSSEAGSPSGGESAAGGTGTSASRSAGEASASPTGGSPSAPVPGG